LVASKLAIISEQEDIVRPSAFIMSERLTNILALLILLTNHKMEYKLMSKIFITAIVLTLMLSIYTSSTSAASSVTRIAQADADYEASGAGAKYRRNMELIKAKQKELQAQKEKELKDAEARRASDAKTRKSNSSPN
jgi:hypothetical protein